MPFQKVFVVLILSLLCAGLSFGQESTGSILGTVVDESGAAVPGAKLALESPTLPRGLRAESDAYGKFTFPVVPVGIYTLTVSKEGFATVRQLQLEVKLGSQVTYNPRLKVGQITQTVEVTASAISLDVTSSRTATNITATQFESLSRGRSFQSLLAMAPGVRLEVKNGSQGVGAIQVDGASGSENTYFIDGVEVSDLRRGTLRAQNAIPFEFVKDVQVKSGGFEAEFGGATGGVVNVATRSGSNAFHGEAIYLFTNNGLNPRDRGFWQRSPANANLADFFQPKEDDYSIRYPGGSFGGPILKDRLFFLASYMPEIERTTRTIGYTTGSRTFKQSRTRHFGLGRLDFQPTESLQVNTSWIWSPAKRIGTLANRDARVPAPAGELDKQGEFLPAQAYTASASYAASSRLLFGVRYGYKYQNDKTANYGLSSGPYLRWLNTSVNLPGVPADFQRPNGFTNIISNFQILKDVTTRHNVYLDGSYITGSHAFKAGWAINRVSNDVSDDYPFGRFDLYWGDSFTRGSFTNVRGQYGYYIWEDGVRHTAATSGRNQGFYIQDTWRPHARLTFNLGVRFENEFLPPYKRELDGKKLPNPVTFGWGDKIAPRLGGAWDVNGDGKWKISGSFGYFYDVMKYELARGSFGGDYWFSHVYRLDNANLGALSKQNPGALGARIVSYDNRSLPLNAQGQWEGIDPDIKPYQTREVTFGLDRQLAPRMVFGIRYSRKDLLVALEDIGVLDAEDNEVYVTGNPGFGLTRNTKSDWGQKTPNGKEWVVPKAMRQYDGLEFRLQGDVSNFQMVASYTYSRLYGNYSGLANSDESGRSDPGVSRAYDLPYYYFDQSGSQTPVLGRLGTDRPHTLKFFGSREIKSKAGSTRFGLTQLAYSGTPDTTTVIYQSAPTMPFGRGDMGRTPVFTQTDLGVSHTFNLGEKAKVRFEFDARNLFNQAAVIGRTTQLNRAGAISAAQLPVERFFAGYDVRRFVGPNITTPAYNAIYGLPAGQNQGYRAGGGIAAGESTAFAVSYPGFSAYQEIRVLRLGLRFTF